MRLTRIAAAAASAVALSAGLLTATTGPAAAGPVPNPSLDRGWQSGRPKCWNLQPTDTAHLTATRRGHRGKGARVAGRGAAGSRLTLSTDRTAGCQIPVAAGRVYRLKLWLRSTAAVVPVVSAFSPVTGWRDFFAGEPLPAGRMQRHAVSLPAVPDGVTAVSVGVAFPGDADIVLDDVALTAMPRQVLFRAAFPDADRLVTNEFAYWSPQNPQRIVSPDWEMTSGSLFARRGHGYTGPVDDLDTDATSGSGTNSAVFRLTTREHRYQDVQVRMRLNVARLAATPHTPPVDWDGVHLFLRYRSEFELYYASVARRDGTVVIKKKCRGGPTNGGSYHVIGTEGTGLPIPYGSWARVGATVRNNPDGSVTIALYRGEKQVVTATDTGVGCAPITDPGATGIRGDNAEFEFADFTVKNLG